jgi:RND superfamily putative drug exporter
MLSVVEIVIAAPRTQAIDARMLDLVRAIGEEPVVHPTIVVQWNAAQDLGVVTALLMSGPDAAASFDLVRRLESDIVPGTLGDAGADVTMGGAPAARLDAVDVVGRWQWRIAAAVMAVSFLLLMAAFRSIVIPLKAVAMNLLSTGAALGALVLLFQEGYGARFLPITATGSIELWVPLLLFCVLFGLSTDYHLFVLSRIRESYSVSGDMRASVTDGLHATRGVVVGASVIMAAVFASFAAGEFVALQQLGVGLAIAVVLDATVIRGLLAPAAMVALGRWNWYWPGRSRA